MPKRAQLTDAEREQRRAADRAFVQDAVEQLRSSDGWQRWLTTRRLADGGTVAAGPNSSALARRLWSAIALYESHADQRPPGGRIVPAMATVVVLPVRPRCTRLPASERRPADR